MMVPIREVLVVGGGTAGWLTAAVVVAERRALGDMITRVTLVESPDIPTIGVGEGTWPSMRTTLQRIGLPESELLRQSQASFKQGTKFVGWSGRSGQDIYYHPFSLPAEDITLNLAPYWLHHGSKRSFAEFVTPQAGVIEQGLAPKQIGIPDYAFAVNYAYHLDAGKFAQLLKEHAIAKLGVRHVVANVSQVIGTQGKEIEALMLDNGQELVADLFVDCTGQKALLLDGHMGIKRVEIDQVLFNDSAIAVQVPHAFEDTPIASATISTATRIGWIWDIALQTRRGVGHVFSSAHASEQEAKSILQTYVSDDPLLASSNLDEDAYRTIRFQTGYREQFWAGNCVAVGLSAGFVEPLEASAIALIEQSAAMIGRTLPMERQAMPVVAKRFNDKFSYHWQQIIGFLKLHYAISLRSDSEYWRAHSCQTSWPDSLRDNLTLWHGRPPDYHDAPMLDELFPSASFSYVLYGMGFRPTQVPAPPRGTEFDRAETALHRVRESTLKFTKGLPTNRALIASMLEHS